MKTVVYVMYQLTKNKDFLMWITDLLAKYVHKDFILKVLLKLIND